MSTSQITPEEALEMAIATAGKKNLFAKRIGVSPAALSQWSICPVGRVIAVEAASGVSRHLLRPDYYPPEPHPFAVMGEQAAP